jgi:hypothetical protein
MIAEFLRLKEKVKNGTATREEERRYQTLLAKIEAKREGPISDIINSNKIRWI